MGTIHSLQLSGFLGEVPHIWGWVLGRGWDGAMGVRGWDGVRLDGLG